MLPFVLTAALSAAPVGALPVSPQYKIETTPGKRIRATLSFGVRCPKLKPAEWVAFASHAPEGAGQSQVRTHMQPAADLLTEPGPLGRRVLRCRVPCPATNGEADLDLRVVYEATLHGRRLCKLGAGETPPAVAPLTPVERLAALRPDAASDYHTHGVQRWLLARRLCRQHGESDVAFARRAFAVVSTACEYHYEYEMGRTASAVCAGGRSDCGGLSALYVAALRANGIPAQCLYGRWATSTRPGGKLNGHEYHQWHVLAEFYADGIGWVPVDVTGGVLKKTAADREPYFGQQPGNFLTLHVAGHLNVDTVHFGRHTVEGLQVPVFFVTGQGSMEAARRTERWQVSEVTD